MVMAATVGLLNLSACTSATVATLYLYVPPIVDTGSAMVLLATLLDPSSRMLHSSNLQSHFHVSCIDVVAMVALFQ